MAEEGIRSPNCPPGTQIGEFLGHEIVGTTRSLRRFSRDVVLGPMDALASGLQVGGGITFTTKVQADAHLGYPVFQMGLVTSDPTPANNGIYQKAGASGTGSWARVADLPNELITFTVTGGTGDAITASMSPQVPITPATKLYLLTPTANNTGAAFVNGIEIKNAAGSTLAANSLISGSQVLMARAGDHYQLLISMPVDASGILADAIAARDAAGGYSTAAASSASALGNQVHQYDTRALAIAATIPTGVQAVKITRYASGYPLSYATYIPGTSAGPMAFQEAGGHWWELDLSGGMTNVFWFGVTGGFTVDDSAALNVATAAIAAHSAAGGTLWFPSPPVSYRIHANPINLPANVNLMGEGNASSIVADDVDAIHASFVRGIGNLTISNLHIEGQNATARRTAIKVNGSLVDAGLKLYGVTLEGLVIERFDNPVSMTTVQEFSILNCWLQQCNNGIILSGQTFSGRIFNNKIIYAAGFLFPTGNSQGINIASFNYSGGSLPGPGNPEGIVITGNQIVGFNIPVNAQAGNWMSVTYNSLSGTLYGCVFSNINNRMDITGNYVELSLGGIVGIYGTGDAAACIGNTNILNNTVIANTQAGAVNAVGIQINGAGAAFARENVNIVGNWTYLMTLGAIKAFTPGSMKIADNDCQGADGTIFVDTRVTGIIRVNGNVCGGAITITGSDISAGYVRRKDNVYNGVTLDP